MGVKIHPKAVRTSTNKGSPIGQVIFRNNLTFLFRIYGILLRQNHKPQYDEKKHIHKPIIYGSNAIASPSTSIKS